MTTSVSYEPSSIILRCLTLYLLESERNFEIYWLTDTRLKVAVKGYNIDYWVRQHGNSLLITSITMPLITKFEIANPNCFQDISNWIYKHGTKCKTQNHAKIIYQDSQNTTCICKICKEEFTIRKDGFWQNHFLCSTQCCAVRREQLDGYEQHR